MLPAALAAELDLDGLRPVPGTFVDAALRQRHTDVLFTTTWRDRSAYVYVLIEHQSHSDPWMALRMLSYLVRIWERHRDQHPDQTALPLILPLVVHQGPGRWTAATDIADLFDLPHPVGAGEASPSGTADLPRFRYLVDDLSDLDAEALRTRSLTAAAAIALLVLARARVDPDITGALAPWHDELRELFTGPDGVTMQVALMTYLWRATDTSEQALIDLATTISPQAEEVAMTTAEKLRREGEARGEARGRAGLLTEQLATRFGPLDQPDRDRIAAATPEQISTWSTRLINGADTIDDVLDET